MAQINFHTTPEFEKALAALMKARGLKTDPLGGDPCRGAGSGGTVCRPAQAGSIARLGIEPLSPKRDVVELVIRARHQFPLTFGGCFAYAHARLLSEPLLTLDADFLKTDLPNVLHPER